MNPETVQTIIDDLGALLLFMMILIIAARQISHAIHAVPAGATAVYAHSNHSAAQRSHHARSRAISMSAPATLPGLSLAPRASNSRDVSARRSRCGLHTSSAS